MSRERITRRQALKGLGIAAAGALLAACQPKVVEKVVEKPVEKVVKETIVVEGTPKVVEKLVTVTPAPKATPEIHVIGGALCVPGGGNPEKVEAVRKLILDKTGIKVNNYILPAGTAGTEKLNLMMASGSQPLDLFAANWQNFKGAILPLDDLLQQYGQNILKVQGKDNWPHMKDAEGTTWGYPRLMYMSHPYFPFFRSDWLAELNRKPPTTWDEMEETIAAFKKAHPDSVVFTENRANLMGNTLGAFVDVGNSRWVDPADKPLKPVEVHPGYRDWVERMAQWWKNGWFHKENFAGADARAVLKTLNVGTWLGWYSRITFIWEDVRVNAGYTKEDYQVVEKITGPKGLMKSNVANSSSAWVLPRKSKNPEAAIKYADWQYAGLPGDVTNQAIVNSGIENVDWKWADKSKGTFSLIIPDTAPCEQRYARDLHTTLGVPENYFSAVGPDGKPNRHQTFIRTMWNRYDTGKTPIDYDVPYDMSIINKKAPKLADLNRLFEEETIKFITGMRPLSEWDAFLKQAEGAGLKEACQAYTEQYRIYHPA